MKKSIVCFLLASVLALCAVFCTINVETKPWHPSQQSFQDISFLCEKQELSEEDYDLIFSQTGLGKAAVDQLKTYTNFKEELLSFQQNFFKKQNVKCVREAITTCMEYNVDAFGQPTYGFKLAPYKSGYVFLMFSSHSFGWRHGHAGIVISYDSILEAPIIGEPTAIYSERDWCEYSTFIMLRLKNADDAFLEDVATNAKQTLQNTVYDPIASALNKFTTTPKKVQCAYLVWNAFYQKGIDIDKDKGIIVTVDDILNLDMFDIVQVYGIDPKKFYKS